MSPGVVAKVTWGCDWGHVWTWLGSHRDVVGLCGDIAGVTWAQGWSYAGMLLGSHGDVAGGIQGCGWGHKRTCLGPHKVVAEVTRAHGGSHAGTQSHGDVAWIMRGRGQSHGVVAGCLPPGDTGTAPGRLGAPEQRPPALSELELTAPHPGTWGKGWKAQELTGRLWPARARQEQTTGGGVRDERSDQGHSQPLLSPARCGHRHPCSTLIQPRCKPPARAIPPTRRSGEPAARAREVLARTCLGRRRQSPPLARLGRRRWAGLETERAALPCSWGTRSSLLSVPRPRAERRGWCLPGCVGCHAGPRGDISPSCCYVCQGGFSLPH